MRLLFASVLSLFPAIAVATECPSGVPSCKILILTPDEEKSLTAPQGILSTAAQARALDLGSTVQYFFLKIQNAPKGEVKKTEPVVKK